MTYEQFIQQYTIHNHGGVYDNDHEVINTAERLANNLVYRGYLSPKKEKDF